MRAPVSDIAAPPRRIGLLLIEGYPLMSAAAAVEPLRAANLLSARPLYALRFLSEAGGPAVSSAGSAFPTEPPGEPGAFDLVLVLAGGDPLARRLPRTEAWLRRLDARGVRLGGISGGAAILARAGLMRGRRFTVHWEHHEALLALDPDLLIEPRLWVIDRDRVSCAGGIAALDMMHALIAAEHGAGFAQAVSDWFIHTQVRAPEAPQRAGAAAAHAGAHPAVQAALALMESHLADPLSVEQLAALTGLSSRQLLRLFRRDLGKTARRAYLELRLAKAAELGRQTRLPAAEIAALSGFASAAHLARSRRAVAANVAAEA